MNNFEHTILVIDYDTLSVTALTHLLSDEFNVVTERRGSDSINTAREVQPDVILLDVVLPDMNGFEIITLLKKDELTKDIPVIFVTGLNNTKDEEQGLMLGAVDYINKPFSSYIVKLRIKNQLQIAKQIQTIRKLSTTDPLTGATIRKNLLVHMDSMLQKAAITSLSLGFALFSVNNFKHYNENYGYQKGDEVIKRLFQIVSTVAAQDEGSIARWSGNELAVFFCSKSLDDIKKVVDDIFITIEKDISDITLSVGIHATNPNSKYTIDNLILHTSAALTHAKRTGRGKVSTYEEARGSI